MFDKTLKENADETFKMAEKALKKIIDGEVTYQNFRNYVINLHNAYELYFKYELLKKNECMLFDFKYFDNVPEKYQGAFKENKTLIEYIKSSKKKLPNTVSFKNAIKRLADLYKEDEFNPNFIEKLYKLHKLRNDLTHFECKLGDVEFELVSRLFIRYSKNYDERYQFNYYPEGKVIDINEFEEKLKNKKLKKERLKRLILEKNFNQNLLEKIKHYPENYGFWDTCMFGYKSIAKNLVSHYKEFTDKDIEKIRKRLEILKYAGLIDFTEDIIEVGQEDFKTIINIEVKK